MPQSNVQPVYPNAIFPWIDRVDEEDIVFAEDVNPLAAEIESIENTVGLTPQIEPHPPQGGAPINYPSISARISDAMDNAQLPVVTLSAPSFTCPNNTAGTLIPYQKRFDPFNCYNGTDVTAPASGWWIVTATHNWSWWQDGYCRHFLCLNGFDYILCEEYLDWGFFSGNFSPYGLYEYVGGVIAPYIQYEPDGHLIFEPPRWWVFGKRPRQTTVTWQGLLNKGDRLSCLVENGTSNPAFGINSLSFKAIMIKTVSGNFQSG